MKLESKPLLAEYKLSSDPEGIAVVRIHQATTADLVARDGIFSRMTSDNKGTHQNYNPKEIHRMEAYRVLSDVTGILMDDNELFRSQELAGEGVRVRHAMTEQEFFSAWGKLPPEVTLEITNLVHKVNPIWSLSGTGE